jgi:hypothetical protein
VLKALRISNCDYAVRTVRMPLMLRILQRREKKQELITQHKNCSVVYLKRSAAVNSVVLTEANFENYCLL